jgi:hypothetical protein
MTTFDDIATTNDDRLTTSGGKIDDTPDDMTRASRFAAVTSLASPTKARKRRAVGA